MNIKHFFSYQNLFQVNSAFVDPKEKLLLFAGLILVLLSIVLKIASVLSQNPIEKKYRQKFYRLFLSIGLSELVWYWCRTENVRFFQTHFVALIIALVGVVWLINISIKTFKNYSTEKTAWEKEQVKLKYLPK